MAQEARDRSEERGRTQEIQRRCMALDAQTASLRMEVEAEQSELTQLPEQERFRLHAATQARQDLATSRDAAAARAAAAGHKGRGK